MNAHNSSVTEGGWLAGWLAAPYLQTCTEPSLAGSAARLWEAVTTCWRSIKWTPGDVCTLRGVSKFVKAASFSSEMAASDLRRAGNCKHTPAGAEMDGGEATTSSQSY